jgi:hypothetical protein
MRVTPLSFPYDDQQEKYNTYFNIIHLTEKKQTFDYFA